jgi:hypothetical protein
MRIEAAGTGNLWEDEVKDDTAKETPAKMISVKPPRKRMGITFATFAFLLLRRDCHRVGMLGDLLRCLACIIDFSLLVSVKVLVLKVKRLSFPDFGKVE